MNTDVTDPTKEYSVPNSDFTAKVIGLLYEVHNTVGPGYQEKYYQRAFEEQLNAAELVFERELHCPIMFKATSIGRYFIDFLIEDKLVVELKVSEKVHRHYLKQVLGYLNYSGVRLGLIACFGVERVQIKRVII